MRHNHWVYTNDIQTTKATYYVNGVAMPSPKQITWSMMDLYAPGSGRLLDGNMQMEHVGIKRRLDIEYNNSDTAIFNRALRAISGGGFFSVTYWDLHDWGWRTSTMYAGDRKGAIMHFLPNRTITAPLTFALIER